MEGLIRRLQVIPATGIDLSKETSVDNFYNTPYMRNDQLNLSLVHLYGDQFGSDLALHNMTIAKAIYGNDLSGIKTTQQLKTMEYEWMVMGRVFTNAFTTAVHTGYTSGDLIGDQGQEFFIYFDKHLFNKGFTIESPDETQIRLITSGVETALGWQYKAVVQNKRYVPFDQLSAGVEWAEGFSVHSEEDSEGVEFGYKVVPGTAKNQMNVVRASRHWKGNTPNKQLAVEVPMGEGKAPSKYWMDQEQFFFDLAWMKQKETVLMYGEYNANTNGTVALRETNGSGSVIRVGAGFLQQIPNTFTYSQMTYEFLRSLVMDMYFQSPETAGKSVKLIGGMGALEEIDKACKDYLISSSGAWNTTNDKQVMGNGDKLELTGYFTKVYFIGGYSVEVIHNKLFDYGFRARKSDKHPVTGLPLESYRVVFVDPGTTGDSNVQYVNELGRENIEGTLQGLTPDLKGIPEMGGKISTDRTKSEFHRLGTCGIALTKPTYSMHGTYVVA